MSKITLGIEADSHIKGIVHYTEDGKRFDYMGTAALGDYVATMVSAGIGVELKPMSEAVKG
ncbi:MAG: hypothetical protein ACXABY_20005 [Candidatus Thorarchaeota archaeon]|jgi:hypothetical protein